jgi:cell division protease FtsH
VSDEIVREIDLEIKRFITENYERTKRILTEHMVTLKALAESLFEKEVLEALEIDQIILHSSSHKVSA